MTASEKARLVQQLDEGRHKMRAALEGLDPQTGVYPHWRVKHLLAHLAGWEEATITSLRAHQQGAGYQIPAYRGINAYNEHSVETRQDLNFAQVHKEWELVREELKAVLEAMLPEKFEEPLLWPWGRRGSISQLVGVMIEHEHEHLEALLKLREAAQE